MVHGQVDTRPLDKCPAPIGIALSYPVEVGQGLGLLTHLVVAEGAIVASALIVGIEVQGARVFVQRPLVIFQAVMGMATPTEIHPCIVRVEREAALGVG